MASFSVPCPKVSPTVAAASSSPSSSQKPHPSAASRPNNLQLGCSQSRTGVFKARAQLNQVVVPKISNANPALETALFVNSDDKDEEVSDASSISTFMTQVTDLVKLVDSRDIAELQLKQMDCEVLIRNKEALPQPSTPAPVYFAPPPSHQAMMPPQMPPASAPSPASVPAPTSTAAVTPPAPAKPKSSHPPFKCPMAGTFYQSPAPSAPPFVKVGDKVQKGQVICIIEAMKLMNEIEADHSGTIVEILVEDGKPVSVDLPLFIIEP